MPDDSTIVKFITSEFEGVEVEEANGDSFFFYDPTHMMPFATLVRSNVNDDASELDREGIFRLNVGVSKETFTTLFNDGSGSYDFAALDTIMPHPVYGKMNWICVLNPSTSTFEEVKVLLVEAYERSVRRQRNRGVESEGWD